MKEKLTQMSEFLIWWDFIYLFRAFF